jgi:uncharacterized membrane protein
LNVPASRQESALVRGLRLGACAATALLFALVVRWVVLAPSAPRLVAGAILALPLAIGVPFLYVGHRRSYAWLTLALAPALVLALTEAVANPATRRWAAILVFDLFAAFALCVAYLRATRSSSLPSQKAP